MPYRDPEQRTAYQREYQRMRRAGDCQTPGQTLIPAPFRLKTAHDVLALLAEQVQAVRDEPEAGTLEKARCVGYLAGGGAQGDRGGRPVGPPGGARSRAQDQESGMKGTGLPKLYGVLAPDERFRLVLAARAREDKAEVDRLERTCPRKRYSMMTRCTGIGASWSSSSRWWSAST